MLQCIFVFEWHLRYQSCYCLICWSYFWFQNLSVFKITKLSGKMFNIYRTLEDLTIIIFPEAVTQRCSVTKVFLKILQNSQENNCASLFFDKNACIFLWIFAKFLRTTFFRTPLVAAFEHAFLLMSIWSVL